MSKITLGQKDALNALIGKTIAKVWFSEITEGGTVETTDGLRVTFALNDELSRPRVGIYAFLPANETGQARREENKV